MTSASIPSFKKISFALIALGILLVLLVMASSKDVKPLDATVFDQVMHYCAEWNELRDQEIRGCVSAARTMDQKLESVRTNNQVGLILLGVVTLAIGLFQIRQLNAPLLPAKFQPAASSSAVAASPSAKSPPHANFSAPPQQPSTPPPAPNISIEDELRKLRDLKARGIINDEEYEKLLEKVMSKLN